MKKIFYFFAISAIVLGMVSCGDGNDPQQGPFKIEIAGFAPHSVAFTITPDDEEADYFWTIVTKSWFEQTKSTLEEWVASDIYIARLHQDDEYFQKGIYACQEYPYALVPNSDYILCACTIDEDGKISSPISQKAFKTTIPEGYVDLGLPSKTLWNSVSGYGDVYTYPYYQSVLQDKQSNRKSYYTLMPTQEDWEELITKCDWEWIDNPAEEEAIPAKGYNAYKVTGRNGKYIYLPAAILSQGEFWMKHSNTDAFSAFEFGSTLNSMKFVLENNSKSLSFCWIVKEAGYYNE